MLLNPADRPLEFFDVIVKVADSEVMTMTENTTYFPCFVVVIDPLVLFGTADSTPLFKQPIYFFSSQSIVSFTRIQRCLSFEPNTIAFAILLRVSFPFYCAMPRLIHPTFLTCSSVGRTILLALPRARVSW